MDSSAAASFNYDPLDLNLTSSVYSEYPSVHGPAKPFKVPEGTYCFDGSELISEGIYFELYDNVKNGELSENALAFRCKVFKSIFASEVVGPQTGSKGMSNSSQDGEEDGLVKASDDEDAPRVPDRAVVSRTVANSATTPKAPAAKKAAAVRKPAVKKKVVGPGPKTPLPGLAATGGYDRNYRAKLVNVLASTPDNGVKKPKKMGSRSKFNQATKRPYKWKDPQNKNKKQFYKDRADLAGVSVEEYMEGHNIIEGSVTTTPDRFDVDNQTELTEMDYDLEEQEGCKGNEIDGDEDEDVNNVEEEDDEENLFVTKTTSSRSAPMMTARRVAMIANQYMEDLYIEVTTEPIDNVKSTVKRALDKIKAGAASQMDDTEQAELRYAVERYEDLL